MSGLRRVTGEVCAPKDGLLDVIGGITMSLWLDTIHSKELTEVARLEIERNVDELREALLGSSPSALEVLLVDRILVTYLALNHAEERLALNATRSDEVIEVWHRRVERLQRRLLSAVKSLAEIRRLQLPNIQLNLAQQQVVAGKIDLNQK